MKYVVCKQGETRPGGTTLTRQRGDSTFVMKDVPAQICPNCGEEYLDDKVAAAVLQSAEDLSRAGAQVDIRRYA